MFAHFSQSENLPFSITLVVFGVIGALQIITMLIGFGLFDWMDNLLPEIDMDLGADVDADVELPDIPLIGQILGWLNVGKVPVIISILLLALLFSFIGLGIQSGVYGVFETFIPPIFAAPGALILAIYPFKLGNAFLAKILPNDETYAVSQDQLVGKVARITIGTASEGKPAEAKVKDRFGKTHYVMVEPDESGSQFSEGSAVVLVTCEHGHYRAIPADPALIDS